MTKIMRAAARVTESVVQGFAQIGSMGQLSPKPTYEKKSASDSLRGDWVRIGGDMGRALAKYEQQTRSSK